MSCTEKCWTPVECSDGYKMWPRGRSQPPEAYSHECEEENSRKNTMHLFSEHDSTRWYHDKEGWDAHEASCPECNPALEEDDDDALEAERDTRAADDADAHRKDSRHD